MLPAALRTSTNWVTEAESIAALKEGVNSLKVGCRIHSYGNRTACKKIVCTRNIQLGDNDGPATDSRHAVTS